jgi:dimethylamine/trimethylamine dehydrogenase
MDQRYTILFEPLRIGPKTAPNRFAAVPYNVGHSPLMPNGHIGIREMRAEGGWGIVSTGLCEIDPSSDLSNLPYEKLWDDSDIPRHAKLASAIQKHGALSAVELGHTGARSRGIGTGIAPLAPSPMSIIKPESPFYARAMDKRDIAAFRKNHRAAVARAIKACHDIAYVYAAHDASILWHFLSPAYNHRTDEYGGCFENRLRLFREVLEDAMDEANNAIAIAVRFAVHELSGPKKILHDGEGRAVVEALANLPDLWDVNVSGWSRDSATSRFDEEGHQEDHIAFVKQVTKKPVLGVGRYTSPDRMVKVIKSGVMDIVGAARPSIADPFLPNKIKEGRIDDIRECIGCNACVASDGYGVELRCTQNPTVSEEWRRGWHPEKVNLASNTKNILVIGSGPAGLEAALTLARAGHHVSVAEKCREFGGRALIESRLHGLSAWGRVKDYRLYQLQKMNNVQLFAESEMGVPELKDFGADDVVVATGSYWINSGLGRSHFATIDGFADSALTPGDIVNGREIAGPVVIYDDDHNYMSGVLALQLAAKGLKVELVTPNPIIGAWLAYTLEQPRVLGALHKAGVKLHPLRQAVAWSDGYLHLIRADTGEATSPIAANTLLAVGARAPDVSLSHALSSANIAHSIAGDCEAPGQMQAAVYSGHRVARDILAGGAAPRFKREQAFLLE